MSSSNAIALPPSTARFQHSTVNSQLFCPNSFRFTLLSKNGPANRLESHSCKNKGLKVPCFHTLTKKGGRGAPVRSQHPTSNLQPRTSVRPYWPLRNRPESSKLSIRRPRRGSPAILG